ncbi:MAG: magnesium transporter CorA family protein, partial [Bacteroidales bacterium]|nr:magnesium transporter CorA family protein [Bacteroidales bacterium]
FPTLIASLFGMNLANGMENSSWGFLFAILISLFVSLASWAALRFKRLI